MNNDNNILKSEISCNSVEMISDSKLEINANNINLNDLNISLENFNIPEIKNEKIEIKENGQNLIFSNQKQDQTFLNFISQYDQNNNINKKNNRINKYKNVILNKKYKDKKTNNDINNLESVKKSYSVENSSHSNSYELISFINNDSKNNKNYFNDSEIILKCLKEGTNLSKKRYITLRKDLNKMNIPTRNKNYKSNSKNTKTTRSNLNSKSKINFGKKFLRFSNSYKELIKTDNNNQKNKINIKNYLSFNKLNTKSLKLEANFLNSYRNINKRQITANKNINIKRNKNVDKIFLGDLKLNNIKNNNICKTNKNINKNKKKFLI